jgi:S1-C subfamily serine protease
LNVLGELIGVNTAIRGDAQNIGFAIPASQLREVLPAMLDVERRYRIEAGLRVEGVPPTVVEVVPNSPAARAPIQKGDVLQAIDNEPIRQAVDYFIGLIGRLPRQSVVLTLARAGQVYRATIVLAERPAPDGAALARRKLGVDLEPITPQWVERLGLRNLDGLLVTRVEADSPAGRLGLEPADVLVSVHDRRVKTIEDLGLVLERIDSGQRVRITILRIAGNRLHQYTTDLELR